MTELENTDNLSTENVTVTSDAAFERVTSDIKMENWEDWWYLQQNTAWLVQEVPNISILDISDFLIENKKTLYDRQNWNIVVGKAGRSIEAQPQDTVTLSLSANYIVSSFPWAIHFDEWTSSLNYTVCKIDDDDLYKIDILQDWYYRMSYWWTINPHNATSFTIWIWSSNNYITADTFDWWSYWAKMSWWRSIWNVYLHKWDYVFMDITANDTITVFKDFTYIEIQYQQPIL